MKKELIIFDFFGVLCSEIAPVWFGQRYEKDKAEELKSRYFSDADLGNITMSKLLEKMSIELDYDINALQNELNALICINFDMLSYIEKLREKYEIALLSNAPLEFLDDILDKYKIRKYFDKIFISCHMRVAKPDIKAYLNCIESYPPGFEKIYMIDDNPKNLEHISAIGIEPILFRSNQDVYDRFSI